MKTLGIIFSIMILAFTVKPSIELISFDMEKEAMCCGNVCSSEDDIDSETENSPVEDCSGKPCNPFVHCSTPAILFTEFQSVEVIVPQIENINYQIRTINGKSSYIPEFWQPPKVV